MVKKVYTLKGQQAIAISRSIDTINRLVDRHDSLKIKIASSLHDGCVINVYSNGTDEKKAHLEINTLLNAIGGLDTMHKFLVYDSPYEVDGQTCMGEIHLVTPPPTSALDPKELAWFLVLVCLFLVLLYWLIMF